MHSGLAPSADQILDVLQALRQYRATLAGPAQILLDSLVAAGLDRRPDDRLPDEIRGLWGAYAVSASSRIPGLAPTDAAGWATTPWGTVYTRRVG
jgi:hypothetical protein